MTEIPVRDARQPIQLKIGPNTDLIFDPMTINGEPKPGAYFHYDPLTKEEITDLLKSNDKSISPDKPISPEIPLGENVPDIDDKAANALVEIADRNAHKYAINQKQELGNVNWKIVRHNSNLPFRNTKLILELILSPLDRTSSNSEIANRINHHQG